MKRGRRFAPPAATAALSPSDLLSETPRRARVSVGGRVLGQPGPAELVLSDALASVVVQLTQPFAGGVGDLVELSGVWRGKTLTAAHVTSHARAPTPSGSGEFARLAWSGVAARLVERARLYHAVRTFFEARGFLEVTTPVRVPTPGLDANVNALRSERGFLITSPEHHMKRLLSGGLPRIFQVTPCFRADESGPLHEPEFTMLEWYRAFSDYRQIMQDTEALVHAVTLALTGKASIEHAGRRIDVTPPFRRLSVARAFEKYAGGADALALSETDEARYFELLVDRVEPALALAKKPVFLVDYPKSQAALARPTSKHPGTAERFEHYLGGVELSNR
ncbi:MAG TPA: amino acid--tRNA ligase-related protein, partial [Polyangiaceae bacterium]|nr:amino acid--tRNA ligase-related protein [Polyangiaceae bacterium]